MNRARNGVGRKACRREHLRETKAHARLVARRIKALGGAAETVSVPCPDALGKGATGAKAAARPKIAAGRTGAKRS